MSIYQLRLSQELEQLANDLKETSLRENLEQSGIEVMAPILKEQMGGCNLASEQVGCEWTGV